MEAVEMRLLGPGDDLAALTSLLNRAYAELAAAGFNYTAATQDAVVTGRRVSVGECWLACIGGTVAGTATITLRPWRASRPPTLATRSPS
jgi:hypothetical protein